MSDIHLEREFPVSAARLFEAVTSNAGLLRWWGHEGWTMRDERLDFSREGPWHAAMISEEGNLYKLSGQVTLVKPIEKIGFTWGWHDEEDRRGPESHVTFTVQETGQGSKLLIDHRALPSDDVAAQHAKGWGGPLRRLENYLHD